MSYKNFHSKCLLIAQSLNDLNTHIIKVISKQKDLSYSNLFIQLEDDSNIVLLLRYKPNTLNKVKVQLDSLQAIDGTVFNPAYITMSFNLDKPLNVIANDIYKRAIKGFKEENYKLKQQILDYENDLLATETTKDDLINLGLVSVDSFDDLLFIPETIHTKINRVKIKQGLIFIEQATGFTVEEFSTLFLK